MGPGTKMGGKEEDREGLFLLVFGLPEWVEEKSGWLGGGGVSYSTGGSAGVGWGGFGAADIWIAGVTSGTVVSIGTRDSTSGGGEVTDNYPSGKDVTDEVTVTFKNGSGTAGDQVNIATFSSATIPSNKSVKLNYVLKTANRDDFSKQISTRTVNTTQELSWDFSYSSANTGFTGDIESKSAIIA